MFTSSTAGKQCRGAVRCLRVALLGLVFASPATVSAAGRLGGMARELNSFSLPPEPPYARPAPEAAPPSPAIAAPSYAAAPPAQEPSVAAPSGTRAEFPDWSLRLDPANWLLYGRLGLQLEFAVLDWLTLQTSPVFAVAQQPAVLFDGVRQHSNGIGPLTGSTLEAGFWLSGSAFRGAVLHLGISNYAYRFQGVATRDLPPNHVRGETIDEANYTERRLLLFVGTVYRLGLLALSASVGLGYELNQQSRCLADEQHEGSGGCDGFLLRRGTGLTREAADLNALGGPFYPVSLLGRVAIGLVFDG